jgi:hypothetical protein
MTDTKKTHRLHEILAVESDRRGAAEKIVKETIVSFTKKANLFRGRHKWLEMLSEERQGEARGATETTEIVETVPKKLRYAVKSLSKYWDALLTKEATNQTAVADLVVDGQTIAEALPATWLLGMESKLKQLRAILEVIPTHEPGVRWEPDPEKGDDVYRSAEPKATKREEKSFAYKVLYDATPEHPAQIEKWTVNNVTGTYFEQLWTSTITPARKSELLARCDRVIRATKKARMRANQAALVQRKAASGIINYVLGD